MNKKRELLFIAHRLTFIVPYGTGIVTVGVRRIPIFYAILHDGFVILEQ
jgi:hypothetical protein